MSTTRLTAARVTRIAKAFAGYAHHRWTTSTGNDCFLLRVLNAGELDDELRALNTARDTFRRRGYEATVVSARSRSSRSDNCFMVRVVDLAAREARIAAAEAARAAALEAALAEVEAAELAALADENLRPVGTNMYEVSDGARPIGRVVLTTPAHGNAPACWSGYTLTGERLTRLAPNRVEAAQELRQALAERDAERPLHTVRPARRGPVNFGAYAPVSTEDATRIADGRARQRAEGVRNRRLMEHRVAMRAADNARREAEATARVLDADGPAGPTVDTYA